MNRLWVRLSLFLGLVVLVGALLIIVASQVLVSERLNQVLLPPQLSAADGIVENLEAYYRAHRGWDGVGEFMLGVQAAAPIWSNRLDLELADKDGNPLYHQRSGMGRPDAPPRGKPYMSVPIQVDGATVGALQLRSRTPEFTGRRNRNLPEQLSDYLVLLALGGGALGITFSVVASRSLTAPLSRLAAAAHEIGGRNFRTRVEPKGSDEMVEVAQAFNNMAARLEEAETLRRHLVADVAHELRTPLSVLQGNLRAILDDVYPLEKNEIARLYTQTRLLGRLVNDLHELAQAEAGQLSLNRMPVDLVQLVRETVEVYEPIAEEVEVTLRVVIDGSIPSLPADAARLTQVLHNLLTNALRHTPAGGTIIVSLAQTNDQVRLAIKDSGEGIAAAHLPYVFDRFYRTDRARARDTGGVGLGLAIVRAIVVAHGGQVSVESEGSGQGSTFYVHLPVQA